MLNIAVIGAGYWGRNHIRVYKELQREGMLNCLKICDIDSHHAEQVANSFGIEYVTDYRIIAEDPEIQAVSIVTPSSTHYQLGKELMEAGKDVLIEKPMTMDIGEAEQLVNTAAHSGRILMAGHIFRYHAALQELKRRIDRGELGKIQNLVSNRLHFGIPRQDMGVIYALGIHELDTFCYLLGVNYPEGLMVIASSSYGHNIEETAMLAVDFGRTKGYALESWLVPTYGKRRDLVVVGTERSARIDYLNPQELEMFDIRLVTENGLPVRVEDEGKHTIQVPYAEPLKEELQHFIFCVNSRQKPMSDGTVGLRAVVMAQASLTASRVGRPVRFQKDSFLVE